MADFSNRFRLIVASSVGRKVLTGITGLGLALFVLVHMVGNLTFFSSNTNAYNAYSHALISLGPLFYAIELGLLAFVLVHIVVGIKIYIGKKAARPVDYSEYRSAGEPSKQSLSSRTMILTGAVLLVFTVLHLVSFKYGPGIAEGYVVNVEGESMRDLRRLLIEKFQSPLYAFGYPAVMILLGFHLRHGIWSALQSLGAMNPRLTPAVYAAGGVLAALIAVGFLILPLWIFFGGAS